MKLNYAVGNESKGSDSRQTLLYSVADSAVEEREKRAVNSRQTMEPDVYMSVFNEEKRAYFQKHNLSDDCGRVRDNPELDAVSLFEMKSKQSLLKTFKFNAATRFHIKTMKFGVGEYACESSHRQHAKMAFYDTLLNKGSMTVQIAQTVCGFFAGLIWLSCFAAFL